MTDSPPTQLTLAGDEKPKTKYTFVSTDAGCLVQRIGGFECLVEYADTYIRVNGQPCGVYVFRRLERLLAETFADWVSPGNSNLRHRREECVEMIERALHSRIYAQWRRIVTYIVPPEVAKLARKMFNSVVGDAAILHFPALYTDEYKHLRADLNEYHACRMYAKFAESDSGEHLTIGGRDIMVVREGLAIQKEWDFMARASAWRERLTPTIPYKALNKTLDSIAWGISWKHIHRLSTMRLENPITTRLHLAFALAASDHHNWGLHERLVLAASDQLIIQAGEVMGYAVTTRTKKDVLIELSHQILDYPEAYGGDLLGLARHSHDWHEAMRNRPRPVDWMTEGRLPPETPMPLLDFDYERLAELGIVPLRTAGDCYREHDVMGHCVHTYATKAEKGLCYLFHVEHDYKDNDGNAHHEQATIELLPDGDIGQAEGPDHEKNQACKHGIAVLRRAFLQVKGRG